MALRVQRRLEGCPKALGSCPSRVVKIKKMNFCGVHGERKRGLRMASDDEKRGCSLQKVIWPSRLKGRKI